MHTLQIIGLAAEIIAVALIGILLDRWLGDIPAVVGLCLCLIFLGWLHWGEIRPLISKAPTPVAVPTPPLVRQAPLTAAEIADAVAARLRNAAPPSKKPTPQEVPTSVLVMAARMNGGYGPKAQWTQLNFDITNPPDEPIRNLDLKIGRVSKLYIRSISDPYERTDCKAQPVNTFPELRKTFRGKDPNDSFVLDSDAVTQMHMQNFGSIQWSLLCQNVSGKRSLRFYLDVQGDAEDDSLQVSGKYELIPSKGSTVVKVENVVPVMK